MKLFFINLGSLVDLSREEMTRRVEKILATQKNRKEIALHAKVIDSFCFYCRLYGYLIAKVNSNALKTKKILSKMALSSISLWLRVIIII